MPPALLACRDPNSLLPQSYFGFSDDPSGILFRILLRTIFGFTLCLHTMAGSQTDPNAILLRTILNPIFDPRAILSCLMDPRHRLPCPQHCAPYPRHCVPYPRYAIILHPAPASLRRRPADPTLVACAAQQGHQQHVLPTDAAGIESHADGNALP